MIIYGVEDYEMDTHYNYGFFTDRKQAELLAEIRGADVYEYDLDDPELIAEIEKKFCYWLVQTNERGKFAQVITEQKERPFTALNVPFVVADMRRVWVYAHNKTRAIHTAKWFITKPASMV